MNSNEKRWIVLLVLVVIIAIILGIVIVKGRENNNVQQGETTSGTLENEEKYVIELEDRTKLNTSEALKSEKTYKNLSITNIQYTEKEGISILSADVTNKGETIHESEIVKITILGENDETIAEINSIIGKINPGETIRLNASILEDVLNAKDFKIEAID